MKSKADFIDKRTVFSHVLKTYRDTSGSSIFIPAGIPTGFFDLDYKLCGLQRGDLILLAGRAFMGKTALALSICRYIAEKENKAVAYFSPRISGEQIATRLLSMDAQVKIYDLAAGKVNKDDWLRLKKSAGVIADAPLYINDSPYITAGEMRSKCLELKKKTGLDLIVVDSLQFVAPDKKCTHHSAAWIKRYIISSLKKLAVEMDCPVVVIAKLPELINLEENKRPEITDLRISDFTAQYADVILFMYREQKNGRKSEAADQLTDIIIAKNRSGKDGVVKLKEDFDYARFVNYR
ncbi:MAG: DnaB-like helicase C-terminal domain-containing protein [Lachnospiraceae bacterium]|nr:DnaB-like helicase C-terminal domain-containing protein [Lachnospiraceae bacterium]